jgi:hypothetical protein
LLAIPSVSYMDYSPVTKLYTSRVYFTETAGGVLGSNAMQGHNVVFDWENGRVGFAESSCTYDKNDMPAAVHDHGYSADCIVADPIVSKSCFDTVDRRLCRDHPTNIALLGTEVWTAVVESAGTDFGLSCVESAKSWAESDGLDEPIIKCNGDGLCEEHRPCQLTCNEADKATRVKQIDPSTSQKGLKCGDSFWSACDYGCIQSRMSSKPFSDGHCHEVSRQHRACHVGACARSDPCRVPFLIHAVLGFKGAYAGRWTEASEDAFTAAISQATRIQSQLILFHEGDINILSVLPWFDDEDYSGVDEAGRLEEKSQFPLDEKPGSVGFKIVLEIALVNPLARETNSTKAGVSYDTDDSVEGKVQSILRSIPTRLRSQRLKATCNPDDLYRLAQQALVLRKETLQNDKFMPTLLEQLKKIEIEKEHLLSESPFERLYHRNNYAEDSRLISSWSIRTEIDDEINYFGPSKPVWFRLLSLVHTLVFALMAFMLLTTAWSIVLACYDAFSDDSTARTRGTFWRRRQRNSIVGLRHEEDHIMGLSEVELTMQPSPCKQYNIGTPKKRRSTLNSFSGEGERLI